jgi:gliding motility-associated-like protein
MKNGINFIHLAILLLFLFTNKLVSQIAIKSIPNLKSIIAHEVTGVFVEHKFNLNDAKLYKRLSPNLTNNNDFGGVPGTENYDIYISDAQGNIDTNGANITIECNYLGTSLGGGFNISQLELEFTNGFKISPTRLSSFFAAGNNYDPRSELLAVDCDNKTFSTLGNNSATLNNKYLRLTFDFSTIIKFSNFSACEKSNFDYSVGTQVFNQSNPNGVAYVSTNNKCNMIEIVDIKYIKELDQNINYLGCIGDNYQITIGGKTFNEQNPTGNVLKPGIIGCDTNFIVNLKFVPMPIQNFDYTGCKGNNYQTTIGGETFNELNPTGKAIKNGKSGCDTIINVNLKFEEIINSDLKLTRCKGSQITIGGETFNEQNPFGTAIKKGTLGCDTIFSVQINFKDCNTSCELLASNVISSNNKENNLFEIKTNCLIEKMILSIYDRWGNLIKKDETPNWDGKFNDNKCENGVYVYLYEYWVNGERFIKTGDISLLD